MKQLGITVFLFLSLYFFNGVYSHSWVACSDYRYIPGTSSERYYDDTKCFGYAPQWDSFKGNEFGGDTGFNFQSKSGTCQPSFAQGYTSSRYTRATWPSGGRVCMAWPSKNHAKGTCTNQYIPDGGVVLIITGNGITRTIDLGSADKGTIGYQNCPAFCENGQSDKILCHRCFNVPSLPAGTYKVAWEWVFNPGDPYITCFEVIISGSSPNTPTTIAPSNTPTTKTPTNVPTVSPTSKIIIGGDYNAIINPNPITITPTGNISLDIEYKCKTSCWVIIDLLDPTNGYAWYGKASRLFSIGGSGSAKAYLVPLNNPPKKSGYILKIWSVKTQDYNTYGADKAYLYETSSVAYDVTVGNEVKFVEMGRMEFGSEVSQESSQQSSQELSQSSQESSSQESSQGSSQGSSQSSQESQGLNRAYAVVAMNILGLLVVLFF